MIGRLVGKVGEVKGDYVLLDVGGVFYKVEGSQKMLAALPKAGGEVRLDIETYVREDQMRLFGFLSEDELRWFRNLLSVQGIGVKAALAVQSVLSVQELEAAIQAQDKDMISRAPGVGAKVAQRILQELKDKVGGAVINLETRGEQADALSALVNLGYQKTKAHQVLSKISKGMEQASAQDLIRASLKALGK